MYKPVKLEIVNLLSHKNTIYKFVEGVAVMVIGENKDDDGQENNGSGKSVLIEAIVIALTGSPFRKIKDTDLLFYGEDQCEIILHLENAILGEVLSIKRNIFSGKGKSSTLQCFVNGVIQDKAFPTVRDGNKWILDRLGVSREDLVNYFIVSKSKSVSFFLQSDTQKKEIVTRFSGTGTLLDVKEEIKLDIDTSKKSVEEKEQEILRLETKLEIYQNQLTNYTNDEQEKNKLSRIQLKTDQITSALAKIESCREQIKLFEKEKTSYEASLQKAELEKKNFKIVSFDKQLSEIEQKELEYHTLIKKEESCITTLEGELSDTKTYMIEVEQNIKDSIHCPKCQHQFVTRDESFDIEAGKLQIPELKSMISEYGGTITSHQESIALFRERVRQCTTETQRVKKELREQEDKLFEIDRSIKKLKNGLQKIEDDSSWVQKSITTYSDSIRLLESEILLIKDEKVVDGTLAIRSSISEAEKGLELLRSELEERKLQWVKLKELEVTFTKFITHLCNKAIKSIELRTNEYLKNMGSNLSISIEGYKLLSDGTIRERFTTVVLRDGLTQAFFENYSEGEKERINIACTLALNNLLNMSCENGRGLSLVVLDEMMGSLDRLGVGSVMNSLSKLNQTILAISHVEPKQVYPHTMTIVKEKGVSTIK